MNNTVEVIEENWLSVTQVNGMKNSIMQVPYFLNGAMVNLCKSKTRVKSYEFKSTS